MCFSRSRAIAKTPRRPIGACVQYKHYRNYTESVRSSAGAAALFKKKFTQAVFAELVAVYGAVARRDHVPVDVVEKARDVGLAILVIDSPRVIRHITYNERIGADPSASVSLAQRHIVPTIIVRIVDERRPRFSDARACREVLAPVLELAHMLAHVAHDIARRA